ncbi:MAG: DUF983 domain-containing protein [Saprospiraceae bacterium]|nr:DUF983 domain-containing protein [Saprospiraceae bacterium]
MNLLKSIVQYRCPRCRTGKLFNEPFDFYNPLDMPERCPTCNQHFEPEPGFYFGAMFVSYGLSAILLLVPALILVLGYDWSATRAMIVILAIGAISFFRILRLSRSVWIHINVKYQATPVSSQEEG